MQRQKIILDTDIGDDIDDAFALALICACPEVELTAIATVFRNAVARTRQARTILTLAGPGFQRIPVAAGCGSPDAPLPNQDPTCLPETQLPPVDARHGVDLIIDTIRSSTGDVLPVTIGPLTNLATALIKCPDIAPRVPKILCMAGEFDREMAEWNVRCDPSAAAAVFSSSIPMDIIPWSIGNTVSFAQSDIDRLASVESPIARYLLLALHAWQSDPSSVHKRGLPHLYDPMTIATWINPDLVEWKTGTVTVELHEGDAFATSVFCEDADGKHRVAFNADRDAAIEFFFSRILSLR